MIYCDSCLYDSAARPEPAAHLTLRVTQHTTVGEVCSNLLYSQIDNLIILDSEQTPHRVLVLKEANTWCADAVAEQSLDLRRHCLCLLGWHHEVLVLGLTIIAFCEEQAYILTHFISTTRLVG